MPPMKKTRLTFNEREIVLLHRAMLEQLVLENTHLVNSTLADRENLVDNTRLCLNIISKIGEAEKRLL